MPEEKGAAAFAGPAASTAAKPEGFQVVQRMSNPAGSPIFYANNTTVGVNQWDVQIYFSLIRESSPGTYSSVDQAVVIMTPEHALAVLKAIQKGLENFESIQGKIRVVVQPELPELQPLRGADK